MKTEIDFLKFRTKSPPFEIFRKMGRAFGDQEDLLHILPEERGVDGFQSRIRVKLVDLDAFIIDFGGESQRGWMRVTMTGSSCELVKDWEVMQGLVDTLEEAEIKRVDVQLTTVKGEVTHQIVLDAYAQGRFKAIGQGRNPTLDKYESTDPWKGKTVYIGSRKSAKMLRCYEKGLELVSKMARPLMQIVDRPDGISMTIDGHEGTHLITDIYRVEVEFKAENTIIGWDVLYTKRDEYFAGSYPFCADLLPGIKGKKVNQDFPEMKARRALIEQASHCRMSYGGVIAALSQLYDAEKVVAMLSAKEPTKMLEEAGLYLLRAEKEA